MSLLYSRRAIDVTFNLTSGYKGGNSIALSMLHLLP